MARQVVILLKKRDVYFVFSPNCATFAAINQQKTADKWTGWAAYLPCIHRYKPLW
ncbi:hypothetical protein [Hoylesella pleuritidis]|uniref:hypothetical protein n=1 Tax=Hoylesella pleuritidis TaxID=407975 RepID=UPI0028D3E27D|nr:hypothetical protein [Hoylesella pleuritidis]